MQYKVLVINKYLYPGNAGELEEILNEYAKGGWELVNIIPQVGSTYSSGEDISCVDSVYTECNVLIFKK